MSKRELREFSRLNSGVEVYYREDFHAPDSREYITAIVENYSFGGMFLVTDAKFPLGTVLALDFYPDDDEHVSATAVVTWQRRFRKPYGVGLKFLEFKNIGERDFHEMLKRIFEPEESL